MSSTPAKPLPENARILVVKFNAIGDLVMTTPALRDLRRAYPSAHIALLVGEWSAPAIRANPNIDEVIAFDSEILNRMKIFKILRLLRKIRKRRFDAAVILHARPSIHLFIRLAGIPVRYGMTRGKARGRWLTAAVPENMAPERYYAENYQEVTALAGAESGSPFTEAHASPEDAARAQEALARAGLKPDEDYLVVAPGGARNPREDMSARRWPKEKFAGVVLETLRDHPTLRVVLTGAAGDREETSWLAGRVPGAIDLTGKISLAELFEVVRGARAVLCNDSSVLHIGIACGVPSVAVFGPTAAKQRAPEWALPYLWQAKIECSPCYSGGGRPFPGCPIAFQCLRDTGTAQVRPLLDRALARPPARS
jgi:lipopolysaccharide heptosyltransferase II